MATPDYGNQPGAGPLRPYGVSTDAADGGEDLPSKKSKAAKDQEAALVIVRDLMGGALVVRGRAQRYLPQAPGEDDQNYKDRLQRSKFFNAFGNAVEALTGFVFAKDPKLGDDVPAQIVEHWENIDNAGTHGDVFAREMFQDALAVGHDAILVEFPKTNGQQTKADESGKYALRPYWVPILKDNIVSWRTQIVDGRRVLTQLVLRECTVIPDGQFGEKEQTRYRVFYNNPIGTVFFRLLEVTEKKEVNEVDSGSYPTQDEIPVAEIKTSGKRGLFESVPPMIDLADLNIQHYMLASDHAWSMHKTCVPTYVLIGADPNTGPDGMPAPEVKVGPNSLVTVPQGGDFKVVAHSGNALGDVRQSEEDQKSEMAILGVSMLASDKRVAETAEAKRIDEKATASKLGVAARGLQDAIEQALYFHARYLKLEDGGSIEINRDYDGSVMSPELMAAYANLCEKLGLPLRVVLERLQQGGRIPPEENLDELVAEMEATKITQEEERRRQEEERMARLKEEGGIAPV